MEYMYGAFHKWYGSFFICVLWDRKLGRFDFFIMDMLVRQESRRMPARWLHGDAGAITDDAGANTDYAGDNTDDTGEMTQGGLCYDR